MTAARLSTVPSFLSVVSVAAMCVLSAGCSSSVEVEKAPPRLSVQKLASSVAVQLAVATGQSKPHVTCSGALVGKVGNTTRCRLVADDGSTVGVTVKVSSVHGDRIHFALQADGTASPAAKPKGEVP